MWAEWLHHPCRLGGPQRSRAGDKIRSGPMCGRIGYITPTVWVSPSLPIGGQNQKSAHVWVDWRRHPFRWGGPQRFKAGDEIKTRPICGRIGYVTVPFGESPSLHSGRQNQKWAHVWAHWLRHPCRLEGPQRFTTGDKMRSGPTCGWICYVTPAVLRSPTLQSGGQNQKWAHVWRIGYVTPAVLRVPIASKWGTKPKLGPYVGGLATSPLPSRWSPSLHGGKQNQNWAHMWADWLHHPYRLGGPHRFTAGDKVTSGSTCGRIEFITPTV